MLVPDHDPPSDQAPRDDQAPRLNPYYLAYMRSRGFQPAQLEAFRLHEEAAWPGGRAAGFMLWMSIAYERWAASCGYTRYKGGTSPVCQARLGPDRDTFGPWLETYCTTPAGMEPV